MKKSLSLAGLLCSVSTIALASPPAGSPAPISTYATGPADVGAGLTLGQWTADIGMIDLRQAGCPMDNTTDCSAALSSAIAAMNNRWAAGMGACIYFPPGQAYLNTPLATVPAAGVPACFRGAGAAQSWVRLGSSFTGDFYSCDNANQNGQDGPTATSVASPAGTFGIGCQLRDLKVIGTRAAAGQQNGASFYGTTDFTDIENVDMVTINGPGFRGGFVKNAEANGVYRESQQVNFRIFDSGAAGVPSWDLESNCASGSCASGSASNNDKFLDLNIYGSYGPAAVICNQNTNQALHDLQFYSIRVEQNSATTTTGDNLDIGLSSCAGPVQIVDMWGVHIHTPQTGYVGVRIGANSNSGTRANAPADISLHGIEIGKGNQTGTGIQIDAGYNITMDALSEPSPIVIDGCIGAIELDLGLQSNSITPTVSGCAASNIQIRDNAAWGQLAGNSIQFGTHAAISNISGTGTSLLAVSGNLVVGDALVADLSGDAKDAGAAPILSSATSTGTIGSLTVSNLIMGTRAVNNIAGSSTTLASLSGTTTSGDAVMFDSAGNVKDAGGPPLVTGPAASGTFGTVVLGGTTLTAAAGNTGTLATQTGTLQSGHCVTAGAGGSLLDSGAACGASVAYPAPVSGNWYGPRESEIYAKCTLAAAGQIAYYPVTIDYTAMKITELGVDVASDTMAGTFDLGLYSDSNGVPGTLLVDAGQVSLAAGQVHSSAFSTLTLARGRYWVAEETVSIGSAVVVWGLSPNVGASYVWAPAQAGNVLNSSLASVLVSTQYGYVSSATGTGALPTTPAGTLSTTNAACIAGAAWLSAGGTP